MTRLALTLVALVVAQTAVAQDFSNVRSGMLLGVYTQPGYGGMRVTSLIPGYSAEGRLLPGDVLLRVAVDQNEVYRVRSLNEMEETKMRIGPNREAALEIWRPNQGLMYAWVEFTPIYGPAAAAAPAYGSAPARVQQPRSYAARFKMENEKQGARAMFQGGSKGNGGSQGGGNGHVGGSYKPTPRLPSVQLPKVKLPKLGQFDASRLFNR